MVLPRFKKSAFVSVIILFWSIAPARAQYSFKRLLGTTGDDRPANIVELSNGSFLVLGSIEDTIAIASRDYAANLNAFGLTNWELIATKYSYQNTSAIELNNKLYIGKNVNFQAEGNAGLSIVELNGKLLFDTIYTVSIGGSSGIEKMMLDNVKNQLVSIGIGLPPPPKIPHLIFQLTTLNGKRLSYQYFSVPEFFKFKTFFKHVSKSEYLVFGQKTLLHIDSMGKQVGKLDTVVTVVPFEEIYDVVQLADGSLVSLVKHTMENRYYLQFHDMDGLPTGKTKEVAYQSKAYIVLNTTKQGGFILGGTDLLLLDSNLNKVWSKPHFTTEQTGISKVGQAADGGFYGVGLATPNFDSSNYDIYVFKTTPEGNIQTSVQEFNLRKPQFQLYPNPNNGSFTLMGVENTAQLSVSDLTGKVLVADVSITTEGKVELGNLSSGLYLLNITQHGTTTVQKISIR